MAYKMNMRLIVCALLACLLLIAQHGAAVHALSHLSIDTTAQSQQDPQAPDLDLHVCEKCTGYAGLSATLHANSLLLQVYGASFIQLCFLQSAVPFQTFQSYFSRAPPSLVC